ncbi:MAG: peptidyl-prolyl cis-trans isomerase [Myxococcales bacterium]
MQRKSVKLGALSGSWSGVLRNAVLASSLLLSGACNKSDANKVQDKAPATKHGLTPDQAKQPLVVIGDTTITVGDFADQLADKSPYLRARYTSPERRRELLDELVKFELLAREATRRGLDATDEVVNTKKQVMIQQMMKSEFEDKVKLSDITDQEIEAYYNGHPQEYNKPAQVRASQILIKDEAKAKKVLKQVLDNKDDNKLFRELASNQSEDPVTAQRFGDLQFFSLPAQRVEGDPPVPDSVATAAFTLNEVGEIYPQLVKSNEGYHILKLTGRRKELARTLDQARRPIQHKLWREKREAMVESFVKSLRDKAKVEENMALLDQLKVEFGAVPAVAPTSPAKPKKQAPAAAKESPAP